MKTITIATRGSPLALWQAEHIKTSLEKSFPAGLEVKLLVIKTKGDITLDVPLSKVGGKGLFVKEIEEALLDGRADVAVHSMKDVPMHLPKGLVLNVICKREDPTDIFLSCCYSSLNALPQGGLVGTSSLRRQAQLLNLRPDLKVGWIRGNVETRIRKMTEGQFDAIIMASAGLVRLGLSTPYMEPLTPPSFLPAAGQGAIGLEYKSSRSDLHEYFTALDDKPTHVCVKAERSMLRALNGSCQVPIAAYATFNDNGLLSLEGLIASVDGKQIFRTTLSGAPSEAEHIGASVAAQLSSAGAQSILDELYKA